MECHLKLRQGRKLVSCYYIICRHVLLGYRSRHLELIVYVTFYCFSFFLYTTSVFHVVFSILASAICCLILYDFLPSCFSFLFSLLILFFSFHIFSLLSCFLSSDCFPALSLLCLLFRKNIKMNTIQTVLYKKLKENFI